MNDIERLDYLLAKVSADKKEAFVEDLKAAANIEACMDVLKKYSISLNEEDLKKLATNRELSDAELADTSAGGCCQKYEYEEDCRMDFCNSFICYDMFKAPAGCPYCDGLF